MELCPLPPRPPPPLPIAASLILPVILWGPNYVPVRPSAPTCTLDRASPTHHFRLITRQNSALRTPFPAHRSFTATSFRENPRKIERCQTICAHFLFYYSFFIIYLLRVFCLSVCHNCGTLSYSFSFRNQTDQGDETEGLEMEGFERER